MPEELVEVKALRLKWVGLREGQQRHMGHTLEVMGHTLEVRLESKASCAWDRAGLLYAAGWFQVDRGARGESSVVH